MKPFSLWTLAPFKPDRERATPTPDCRDILGENQQAERDHPETEDRQEPENSTENKEKADDDAELATGR